jgi:hypothetical protein
MTPWIGLGQIPTWNRFQHEAAWLGWWWKHYRHHRPDIPQNQSWHFKFCSPLEKALGFLSTFTSRILILIVRWLMGNRHLLGYTVQNSWHSGEIVLFSNWETCYESSLTPLCSSVTGHNGNSRLGSHPVGSLPKAQKLKQHTQGLPQQFYWMIS